MKLKTALTLSMVIAANASEMTQEKLEAMYLQARDKQSAALSSEQVLLQIGYADALTKHRATLLESRDPSVLNVIVAINEEIESIGNIAGAQPSTQIDAKMKSLRNTYQTQMSKLIASDQEKVAALNDTLLKQMRILQDELVKSGNMDEALQLHSRIKSIDPSSTEIETGTANPIVEQSVVITKEFGGYASAVSRQKLRLQEGSEYTLTFRANLGGKDDLSIHDCLPRFYRGSGKPDFEGGDKNKMRRSQRASEERKVTSEGNGWSVVSVKFTHAYDEAVVFGVVFYDTEDIKISMRDFTLIDSEGRNLISKNLNSSTGWNEGEFVSFQK